jgi:hypothetical protein
MPATMVEPEVEIAVPEVHLPVEENPELASEPMVLGLKQRAGNLLVAIFEGHEEYLGYIPD